LVCIQTVSQRRAGNRCRAFEGAVEAGGATIVPCKAANVLDACISGCLRHPLLVSDENYLDVRLKRAPTLDRVTLNLANVATKRLGDGEDRQHPVEGTAGPGAARRFRTMAL